MARKFNPDFHSAMLANWKSALIKELGAATMARLSDTEIWAIVDENSIMDPDEQLGANVTEIQILLGL